MKLSQKIIIILLISIITLVGGLVFYFFISTQWERDFIISGGDWVANGYKNGFGVEEKTMFDVVNKGNPYYEYQITNTTNRSLSNVVIVFQCEDLLTKWKYEYKVGYLNPHATKNIKVYHWNMYKEHEDGGNHSHYIKTIKYDKK